MPRGLEVSALSGAWQAARFLSRGGEILEGRREEGRGPCLRVEVCSSSLVAVDAASPRPVMTPMSAGSASGAVDGRARDPAGAYTSSPLWGPPRPPRRAVAVVGMEPHTAMTPEYEWVADCEGKAGPAPLQRSPRGATGVARLRDSGRAEAAALRFRVLVDVGALCVQ